MGKDAWMARLRAPTREAARTSLERVTRHQLAAFAVRNHTQLLLARARMACGVSLPQRQAALTAQADVDACGRRRTARRREARRGPVRPA